MQKTIAIFAAFFGFAAFAFSQTDYTMFETIYLKPKVDKMAELKKNLAEHNKEYHADGPYEAYVWAVFTGPHQGELVWAMGPCTFTDLDSRPDSDKHNDDWQNNVMPYLEGASDLEYWKVDDEASYEAEDAPTGKVKWTLYDIKPFEGYRFSEIVKKVAKVYKEKSYKHSFIVYNNQFDDENGHDVAIETPFAKWAFFDEEIKFARDYDEVHGEGSWRLLLEEYKDVVISSTDELAEFLPDLSGGN